MESKHHIRNTFSGAKIAMFYGLLDVVLRLMCDLFTAKRIILGIPKDALFLTKV